MAVTDVRLPAGNGIPENERRNLTVVWVLFLATIFTGTLTAWIGVLVAHIKRGDATTHESYENYTYAIRSFWFTFLWSLAGAALTVIGIGFVILSLTAIWFIYRAVKGLLRTNDNRSAYDD